MVMDRFFQAQIGNEGITYPDQSNLVRLAVSFCTDSGLIKKTALKAVFLENRGFAFRIGTSCASLQAASFADGAILGAFSPPARRAHSVRTPYSPIKKPP